MAQTGLFIHTCTASLAEQCRSGTAAGYLQKGLLMQPVRPLVQGKLGEECNQIRINLCHYVRLESLIAFIMRLGHLHARAVNPDLAR